MRALIIDVGQKKELRDILGRDILEWQLTWLQAQDFIEEIIILSDSFVRDSRQGKVLRQACAEPPKYTLLKTLLSDKPFLLLYGPALSACPLSGLAQDFQTQKADVLCLTGGALQGETFTVEQDRAHKLLSVFGGSETIEQVYIINPLLLTYYFHEHFDLRLFLQEMLKHRRNIYCLPNPEWLEYINTYPAYFQTVRHLLQQPNPPGTKIHNSYYGQNCEIDFSVELQDRQFFGNDCRAEPHSVLKNSVFLDRVFIGANSRVRDSILQKHVKIGRNCELENCLLGENCVLEDNVRLPAGAILAAGSLVRANSGVLHVL